MKHWQLYQTVLYATPSNSPPNTIIKRVNWCIHCTLSSNWGRIIQFIVLCRKRGITYSNRKSVYIYCTFNIRIYYYTLTEKINRVDPRSYRLYSCWIYTIILQLFKAYVTPTHLYSHTRARIIEHNVYVRPYTLTLTFWMFKFIIRRWDHQTCVFRFVFFVRM